MKCLIIFLAVAATAFINLLIPVTANTADSLHSGKARTISCQDTLFVLPNINKEVFSILYNSLLYPI